MTDKKIDCKTTPNEELVHMAKNGNDEALEVLYKNNSGLIWKTAIKFLNSNLEIDDMISMCHVGFMKAYRSFDESKGYTFTTLLGRCMETEILQKIRDNKANKRSAILISIDEPLSGAYEGLHYKDIIEDKDANIEGLFILKEDLTQLRECVNKLSEEDKEIITYYYFEKLTQYKIAEIMGVTQTTIVRRTKKALNNLRQMIA